MWHRQASTRLVGKLRFGQAPLLGASISMSKTSSVQPNLALSNDLVISRSLMLLLAQLGLLIFQLRPAIASILSDFQDFINYRSILFQVCFDDLTNHEHV